MLMRITDRTQLSLSCQLMQPKVLHFQEFVKCFFITLNILSVCFINF